MQDLLNFVQLHGAHARIVTVCCGAISFPMEQTFTVACGLRSMLVFSYSLFAVLLVLSRPISSRQAIPSFLAPKRRSFGPVCVLPGGGWRQQGCMGRDRTSGPDEESPNMI
jgi:hypothetical protein